MIHVTIRGLLTRKLRSSLTAIAIVLGVAMISGTYILTDTMLGAVHTIFGSVYKNTSAVITGKSAVGTSDNGLNLTLPSFPESLLAKVRKLPDVKDAVGSVQSFETKILGRNGKVAGRGGTLGFSVHHNSNMEFNPLTLVAGRWARGPNEVVIDKATADAQGYGIGSSVPIEIRGPVRQFRLVGIAKLGGVSSLGGTTFACFDFPTAQALFGKRGRLDIIRLAARPNVSDARLLKQIRSILPPGTQVKTGAQQAASDASSSNKVLNIFQKALLAFGFIALFVGAFVIFNTLSITVAQRTREFATLRTLGASRNQVLSSVLGEGFAIGVLASSAGLGAGFGIAHGLQRLFGSFGIELPLGSLVFAPRTLVVSLLVGTIVTVGASLFPALRATRVPPIAAAREGATLPRGRFAWLVPYLGVVVLALGTLFLCLGLLLQGVATGRRLALLGAGGVLVFLGVALFSAPLVRPLASVLGAPTSRLGGSAGKIARGNATRNPGRTAATSAALMIGLALVTFVAVFGQGIRLPFVQAVDQMFVADYAVVAQDGFSPISPASEQTLGRLPSVTAVSGLRFGSGRAFGKTIDVSGASPDVGRVVSIDWTTGKNASVRLGARGTFVDSDYADTHNLRLGSPIRLLTPSGRTLRLRVLGIYKRPVGGSAFARVTISTRTFDANFPSPMDFAILLNIRGGVTTANTKTLEHTLAPFPDEKVQTKVQFKASRLQGLNQLLNLLYVLLALSILVSFFGIVNTLVLSIFERTREIGMLRAIGMTRRQTRRMVRYESVTTALIGASLGIALGLALAALVTSVLKKYGIVFAVPWGSLLVFAIAAIVVGLVAAILPARRAARLNVLEALQYE